MKKSLPSLRCIGLILRRKMVFERRRSLCHGRRQERFLQFSCAAIFLSIRWGFATLVTGEWATSSPFRLSPCFAGLPRLAASGTASAAGG